MDLRKYTDELHVKFEHDRVYLQEENPGSHTKPRGFWVSVEGEDDWKSWCEREEFWTHRLVNEQIVVLEESANILYLNTVEEMLEFQNKYGTTKNHEFRMGNGRMHRYSETIIDWFRVVEEYDGIIIPVYQWSCRNTMNWYYGWDAASGCIWNGKAIQSVTRKIDVLPYPPFRSVRELTS